MTTLHEQIGSSLDKRRRTADDDPWVSLGECPTVLSISASMRRANPCHAEGGGARERVAAL
jgi:hypothetical protein